MEDFSMGIQVSRDVHIDVTGDYKDLPDNFFHLDASRPQWIEDIITSVEVSNTKVSILELLAIKKFFNGEFPYLSLEDAQFVLKSIGRNGQIPDESKHTVWFMKVHDVEFLFNLVSVTSNSWTIIAHDLSKVGSSDRFWKAVNLLRPKPRDE
jgi:hypothetical protein